MRALRHLFFPSICYACGAALYEDIEHICLQCRYEIPRAHPYAINENPVDKLFWGRFDFERAMSFIKFQKGGKVQSLIHNFKYKGRKKIGISLGKWAASELKEHGFFDGIDMIIPLPIHKKKLKIRGYNQSFYIAEGISTITQIPIHPKLIFKKINTESQTKKKRFKRWENVKASFQLNQKNSQKASDLHLLLVDDVVTTGATIEACAKVLKTIPNLKLSLLTIACTY